MIMFGLSGRPNQPARARLWRVRGNDGRGLFKAASLKDALRVVLCDQVNQNWIHQVSLQIGL